MEHVDVLIVGAGLSGIGAACHLQAKAPGRSIAILEARDAIGGTWDLFRYPGIRSDSDMFTLGYDFKPWEAAKSIADGPSIREYVRETAREHDVERLVRFGHHVERVSWSTPDARWTVQARRGDGEAVELSCDFLMVCSGYYRYDEGFTPDFPGVERFEGPVIHPQHWPEDLDYSGKRVVVIGSGATAVTLVPAMTDRAQHVTMLQRSPTYIVSLPAEDPVAKVVRRVLPSKPAYALLRWKNVLMQMATYNLSRRRPDLVRKALRKGVQRLLPAGYPIDEHFRPTYDPWDERLCLVPDGDFFRAIRHGKASVVTDHIASFTEKGIALRSGDELEADIVVTATGLNLQALGGMDVAVDGQEVELSETVGYKGIMLTGIPNMAVALGYTNASWTLKCDLTCDWVCRVLEHMREHGHRQVVAEEPPPSVERVPFIDLASGYVRRSLDRFPKQGSRAPWRLHQNYARDIVALRHRPVADEGLRFSSPSPAATPDELVAA